MGGLSFCVLVVQDGDNERGDPAVGPKSRACRRHAATGAGLQVGRHIRAWHDCFPKVRLTARPLNDRFYERALEKSPEETSIMDSLGELFVGLGQPDRAKQVCKESFNALGFAQAGPPGPMHP